MRQKSRSTLKRYHVSDFFKHSKNVPWSKINLRMRKIKLIYVADEIQEKKI